MLMCYDVVLCSWPHPLLLPRSARQSRCHLHVKRALVDVETYLLPASTLIAMIDKHQSASEKEKQDQQLIPEGNKKGVPGRRGLERSVEANGTAAADLIGGYGGNTIRVVDTAPARWEH